MSQTKVDRTDVSAESSAARFFSLHLNCPRRRGQSRRRRFNGALAWKGPRNLLRGKPTGNPPRGGKGGKKEERSSLRGAGFPQSGLPVVDFNFLDGEMRAIHPSVRRLQIRLRSKKEKARRTGRALLLQGGGLERKGGGPERKAPSARSAHRPPTAASLVSSPQPVSASLVSSPRPVSAAPRAACRSGP